MAKIKMDEKYKGYSTINSIIRDNKKVITVEEFFKLHQTFMLDNELEGLAPRTLNDHKIHMTYFRVYIDSINRENIDQSIIDLEILKNYILINI